MSTEVKVPTLGESVAEATIGDAVQSALGESLRAEIAVTSITPEALLLSPLPTCRNKRRPLLEIVNDQAWAEAISARHSTTRQVLAASCAGRERVVRIMCFCPAFPEEPSRAPFACVQGRCLKWRRRVARCKPSVMPWADAPPPQNPGADQGMHRYWRCRSQPHETGARGQAAD